MCSIIDRAGQDTNSTVSWNNMRNEDLAGPAHQKNSIVVKNYLSLIY